MVLHKFWFVGFSTLLQNAGSRLCGVEWIKKQIHCNDMERVGVFFLFLFLSGFEFLLLWEDKKLSHVIKK